MVTATQFGNNGFLCFHDPGPRAGCARPRLWRNCRRVDRNGWLIVWVLVIAPAAATGQERVTPPSVAPTVERVLGRTHQRDLPGLDAPHRDHGPGRDSARDPREALRRAIAERSRRRTDQLAGDDDPQGSPSGPLAGIASMFLWGIILVGAVLIGLAMVRQIADDVGDDAPAPTPATDAQLAAVIARPREDADELASQERFADAIHTLLLRTLHELASQKLVRVTPAMTSREILGKVALLGDARDALQGLIVAVEQTWFGDDVPRREDYQRCRAEFDRFAAAYRRGAEGRP